MKHTNFKILIAVLLTSFIITYTVIYSSELQMEQKISGEQEISREMDLAKKSNDVNKLALLQKKLDELSGVTITKQEPDYPAVIVPVGMMDPPFITDNINIVRISSLIGIRALATTTKQTGIANNAGVLWTVAAVSNTNERDTVYYFKSTDDGVSWMLYGYIALGNSDEVNFDEIDIELVEDQTGTDYMWTVLGITAGNGKKFIGVFVLKTSNFSAGAFALAWPGENFSNTGYGTFKPRITSDNAIYFTSAAVFIVASEDSTYNSGVHAGHVKAVKCNNPFTTTPSFSYRGTSLFSVLNSHNPDPTDLHSDIAYFNRNGDTLITIVSNLIGLLTTTRSNIYFATWNTSFTQYGYGQSINGGNTYDKEYARIASNGGTDQRNIMIIYRENYANSGDWDIKAQHSPNSGLSFFEHSIDVRRNVTNIPLIPDITGRRNSAGKFYAAYTFSTPSFDTVKFLTTNSSGGVNWTFPVTVNHLNSFARPKPGFRFTPNDSCFVIWSKREGGVNSEIWGASGCGGTISIGIQNISGEIPNEFRLEQNYPNPFNPVTKIKFSIPLSRGVSAGRSVIIRITLYDAAGMELETLVNEEMQTGNYEVDFDGTKYSTGVYFYKLLSGSYSAVKKMVLLK